MSCPVNIRRQLGLRNDARIMAVEDFDFFLDASSCVEEGIGSAKGGGGALRGLLYSVGGWEATQRGHAWATREATPADLEAAGAVEGGIRLEDADALELGEAGKKNKTRWARVSLRTRRRLDKDKSEREQRGLPGFIRKSSRLR